MFWWKQEIAPGLWGGFTDTAAGNLALHVQDDPVSVRDNRARLAAAIGAAGERLHFMNQVHSAKVAAVPPTGASAAPENAPEADALVSADAAAPLAVLVADCLPVLFAGTTAAGEQLSAVAHAGRRGLLDGILPNTVSRLRNLGAVSVRAWIGPSICGRCYEVPADMQQHAAGILPGAVSTTSWGTPALDLAAAAAAQLDGLGVAADRSAGACTLEQERLYSYRRNPVTGRFAGLVWRQQ